jgi:anti-sigma regulatory factor (Ser/Thr protein kinase)
MSPFGSEFFMAVRPRSMLIRQSIIRMMPKHPDDITRVVADLFGITTQAVRNHLSALEAEGVLESSGNTQAKKYSLKTIASLRRAYNIGQLQEDVVWSNDFQPTLMNATQNVTSLCSIAFSEMLNNAIDHSGSDEVFVEVNYTAAMITFRILDRGIGIFRKIKEALALPEERMAIIELSKGKLTTSPSNHTGLGIFFTSRMVDIFSLWSGSLFFHHIQPDSDWLIEAREPFNGTCVEFTVGTSTERTPADVYNEFCSLPGDEQSGMAFRKTHVPLRLAQYGNEQLVSRSQAKRVLTRFDRFVEVLLDFTGVEFIGQAFADEVFRVYPAAHPGVSILPINASRQVLQMIHLARDPNAHRQLSLPLSFS